MVRRYASALAVILVITQACSPVQTLPPPAAPDRSLPRLEAPLPPAGGGLARVIVSTDVPARVERVLAITEMPMRRYGTTDVPSLGVLCESTPCVVTLPYGDYELNFTSLQDPARVSSTTLRVQGDPVVLKHALGQERHASGQAIGATLMVTGALLLGGMLALAARPHSSSSNDAALRGLGIAGATGIGIGGLVMMASPTVRQEGSTSQFSPEKAAPVIGMSLGTKF
jgi:hypothetical protein